MSRSFLYGVSSALLLAGGTLMATGVASAATISTPDTYFNADIPRAPSGTPVNLMLNGFDPSLGTLNSVTETFALADTLQFIDLKATATTFSQGWFVDGQYIHTPDTGGDNLFSYYKFAMSGAIIGQTYTSPLYSDTETFVYVDTPSDPSVFYHPTLIVPVDAFTYFYELVGADGEPTASASLTETFVYDYTPVAGVPEPATWALMITGMGVAGAAARRRRSLAVAA